jgi:hypothetical protein
MSTPLQSARALLQAEASALAELATRLDGAFTQTVDLIAAHPGKVVLCGVGKSGLIGQKVAATLCSTPRTPSTATWASCRPGTRSCSSPVRAPRPNWCA